MLLNNFKLSIGIRLHANSFLMGEKLHHVKRKEKKERFDYHQSYFFFT